MSGGLSMGSGLGLDRLAGGGLFEARPFPAKEAYVLADFSRKANLYNNGASGYNTVTDVTEANPYGGSDVVAQHALQTTDRYLIPAVAHAGIDCSSGDWNVELDFRIVANVGSKAAGATTNMTRFNIELYSTTNPASLGANYGQLQAGGGGIAAIDVMSTAPDHATAGRWQTFSCPLGWFVKADASYSIAANLAGTGPDISGLRLARIWTRGNNAPVIEFGQLRLVRAQTDKGLFCLGADDLYASQYDVLFPLAQARNIPLTLWPGDYRTRIGAAGRMTKPQVRDIIAAGGQLANQAVDTENYATLLAQSSGQRLADIDAMIAGQRMDYRPNLDGWHWGSYFSSFAHYQRSGVYDDYAARFNMLRRFDGGLSSGPPLRWGETCPEGDRHNVRALDFNSVTEAQIIVGLQYAAQFKCAFSMSMHDELNPTGPSYAANLAKMTNVLDWVAANAATIRATTPMGVYFP